MTEIDIKEFIKEVHENAKAHGWHDEQRTFGEIIALIHSELSEALEFERDKNHTCYMNGRIDYRYHYSGGGYSNRTKTNELQLNQMACYQNLLMLY